MNILRHLPAVHQLKKDERFSQMQQSAQLSDRVLTAWVNEQIKQ